MNAPALTIKILHEIISDAVKLNANVKAVGVVGSFVRGNENHQSDVDMLVRHNNAVKFNSILNDFGEYVRHVLDYQFNKRLDIIRYDLAVERAGRQPLSNEPWFCQRSFIRLLNEVVWLYEG